MLLIAKCKISFLKDDLEIEAAAYRKREASTVHRDTSPEIIPVLGLPTPKLFSLGSSEGA